MSDNHTMVDHREYELSCVASREEALAEVIALLEKRDISVLGDGKMVSIRLAYPIEKHDSGFFGFIRFSALPEVLVEAEKGIKGIAGILRFLIVTPPPRTVARSDRATTTAPRPAVAPKTTTEPQTLTNEALEQKLEEILK